MFRRFVVLLALGLTVAAAPPDPNDVLVGPWQAVT